MRLKVGLVACCLNTEHIRGMGKYVFELLRQSTPADEIDWFLFGDNPAHGMLQPPDCSATSDVFSFRGDRFRLWEQLGLPLRSIRRNVDVVHCTEGTLSLWQPKPTVVTVHDTLSWDEREDIAGARFYFESLLPAALRRSRAVVTISESSRTDILARWPWLAPKLHVIPHGIEEAYFSEEENGLPDTLQKELSGAAYLVYLGGPMPRKRFDWALQVLANTQHASLKLVACGFGAQARLAAQQALTPELRQRVMFANFLADPELRALYRGASAVLYPTLYEGFGFPAIEAQAAGTPVLFSALGSLKELVGPLAMVVPATDMPAWQSALSEALEMGEQRAVRARAAAAWARKFRWAESFQKHLAVYRQAASGRPSK